MVQMQKDRGRHAAGTDEIMRFNARNCGAFRSNHLKSDNSFPLDRYNDMERIEVVNRLERLAEVRSSVVSRGKTLAANPNYPSKDMIRQMSRLLASKLKVSN